MIKFGIHPKIWEGRGENLRKCWENVIIISFLYLYTYILFIVYSLRFEAVAASPLSDTDPNAITALYFHNCINFPCFSE